MCGTLGFSAFRERDTEATIQDLETRVATLEGQKGVLQGKLSLARQHLLDLGGRSHYRQGKGQVTSSPCCLSRPLITVAVSKAIYL